MKTCDCSYPKNNQAGSNQETTDLVKKDPRVVVDVPSLERFTVILDRALSSLKMSLPVLGRLDYITFKVLFCGVMPSVQALQ